MTSPDQPENENESDSTEQEQRNNDRRVYGYAVFNVNAGCFVDLPPSLRLYPEESIFNTPDVVTDEESDEILTEVAKKHVLDDVDHLKVVEIALDEELHQKSADHFEENYEKPI